MDHVLQLRHWLAGPNAPVTGPVRLTLRDRSIAAIDPAAHDPAGRRLFAMPCLVNAHDHARPLRSSSFGAGGKPLEIWLHYLALVPAMDPYTLAAAALGRGALGGCGVAMIHHTRVQGLTDLPTEASEIARAAREIGVRVGFAVALKDRNPLVYGPSEPVLATLPPPMRMILAAKLIKPAMSVAEQIALVDAVADAAAAPDFDVQYGPTGVQWCSPELLAAIALASERTGRRVHMHCLETRYQRDWADRTFPDGILPYLDGIGLLTPRLTLAHCTHARPDELDLLTARGVTIAVNTSSNLGIRSGIAPVADMVARGCRVALGIDGLALDEDDDALREMRLLNLLHGGTGFETEVTRPDVLRMALHHGRLAVTGLDAEAELSTDSPADLLVLDWDRVDDDKLRADLDPLDLLFGRARAEHIHGLWVGGREIVAEGRVVGIDLPGLNEELRRRSREALRQDSELIRALKALEPQLQRHHAAAPCC